MNSSVRWGQQVEVEEPAIGGSQRRLSMLSITSEMVGQQRLAAGGVPEVRDWTLYLKADGNDVRLAAPNVVAEVRFGSGASSFTRIMRLPAVGCVMHVVATQVDVTFVVADSGLPANGNITLSAYASPGRPSRGRMSYTVAAAAYAFDPIPIPPFATAVMAWAGRPGGSAGLSFTVEYNGLARAGMPIIANFAQWQSAFALAQDATSIVLFPVPADNWLNVHFEVDG